MEEKSNLDFWNSRAKLGHIAGSNDFMLKNLELQILLKKIPENSSVLDIGCGNGYALVKLAKEKNCQGIGVDFSEEMIKEAEKLSKENNQQSKIKFIVGDIRKIGKIGVFDYAFSERCLGNLSNTDEQHKAFLNIMSNIKSGGYYLMIEDSINALNRINELRRILGLYKIEQPWYNHFLNEEFVKTWQNNEVILLKEIPFSSTYYFLSRAIYAKLAMDKNEELKYDSEINNIACQLPPIGDFGPTRMWVWKKI